MKYQIKGEDIIDHSNNPTSKDVEKSMNELTTRIKGGKKKMPHERYFVLFLFAGHGILKDGRQVLVYNEYDKEK